MSDTIASLVEEAEVFPVTATGSTIHEYFESNPVSSGIVIADHDIQPVGLVMRTYFYQLIGTKFGFSIYMNRSVDLLMKTEIMCLDISCELAQFGFKAMSRNENDIFDYIIIMKEEKYQGIVSISNFLAAMSEIKQREIELLSEQQRILKESNEQEKRLRQEIETKNRSIENLLNNADQGFLSFNKDLIIHEEHSSVCKEIFLKPVAGLNFGRLMQDFLDDKQHALLNEVLASLFQQKSEGRAKLYLTLLPAEFRTSERFISINYKIISFKYNKVLMVILTDITDKRALEKKNQDEKNNMKLVLSALNNKTEIIDAIAEARQFFSQDVKRILAEDRSITDILRGLFRVVHTMKGDFALRFLHHSAVNLHRIEDHLAGMLQDQANMSAEMVEAFITDRNFDDIFEEDLAIIKKFLGDGFLESEKTISISSDRLEAFIQEIEQKFTGEDQHFLISSIRTLTNPSLNSILLGYNEYVQILALKLDKIVSELEVSGDVVFISGQLYSNFIKSIIHIFRNIVDHGIEVPDERVEKGKDERGKITCTIHKNAEHFTLEISDDGKGINSEDILKIARAKGIYTEEKMQALSQPEILNTIFVDSFSTKNEVSLLSGRGVGLSAVKNEVDSLNGTIEVLSTINEGTSFKITLPCL
jgi:two-component system chemotaxis sensor kinase CheA